MSSFWDQRFAEPGYKYGTAPNAFLAEQAATWPAGWRVLVPGDGEGRNGVWLARQGLQVLSVDASIVGLGKARSLAHEHGVVIDTLKADLTEWQPEPESVNAVALVFVHLPSAQRRRVHRQLATALRPGGVLLIEAFHPEQLYYTSGGPRDADLLVTLADLREDFGLLLDETLGREGQVLLNEGPGHRGPARLTRYVGCRRI
jgi:SAM-dependent methyltransferase